MNRRSLSTSALHPTNIPVNYARPRHHLLLTILKDMCGNSGVAVMPMILPAQKSNPSAKPHVPKIVCHSRPSTHAATPKSMAVGNPHPSRQRGHPSSGRTPSFNQIDQSINRSLTPARPDTVATSSSGSRPRAKLSDPDISRPSRAARRYLRRCPHGCYMKHGI